MKESRSKQIRRMVSLFLAVIIAAATLFSLIGSLVAHAYPEKVDDLNDNKFFTLSRIKFYNSTGNEVSLPTSKRGKHDIDIHLQISEEGRIARQEIYTKNQDQIKSDVDEALKADGIINASESDKIKKREEIKLSYFVDSIEINTLDCSWEGNPAKIISVGDVCIYRFENIQPAASLDADTWLKDASWFAFDINYSNNDPHPFDTISHRLYDPSQNENANGNISNMSSNNTSSSDNNNSSSKTSDAEDSITTPKAIITGFNIPEVVNPGDEFPVTIDFLNNSKTKTMENLSMTVTPSEGVAIYNGINKRHYISIPKRQTTSETFMMRASDTLKSEALTITVKFEYQYKLDDVYKEASSEEVLSIHSIPKEESSSSSTSGTEGEISKFEILSVIPPTDIYPEEDAYVTVRVINKDHQFDASNVQLTVTGDGLVNNGNTEYHGALAHSTQAEIEMALQFKKAGTYKLEAIVTYEDSTGKDADNKPIVRINDLKKEFSVTVQEQQKMEEMGMGMAGGMSGPNGETLDANGMPVGGKADGFQLTTTHIALIAGGGVVLLVVIIIIVRVIMKKRSEAEDEDV